MTMFDASLIQRAAADAAGGQHYPTGALYVVATPIGNLADLSLRAIHVLALVDAVACEDTRHSAPLLRQLGLDKPMLAVHQHNEREAALGVVQRLGQGERVAYVSDAGTPAVSDPGAVLVAAVRAAGHRVLPIPGASSMMAALSVAGDTAIGPFIGVGFLPTKTGERSHSLQRLVAEPRAQLVFEAPHRIGELAASLGTLCGTRSITVCRELTKQFEAVVTLQAVELPNWLAADAHRSRGEFVLVLHALAPSAPHGDSASHDAMLRTLMAAVPLKQAVALTATLTGASKNILYDRALALRDDRGEPG